MTNQTDRAGSRKAEKITIGQVAEKLLLIARLLERAGVSHEARLQRLTEEYRNVNPGDDKRKTKLQKQKDDKRRAELQKDIADCGKAPLAIMEDSVRKMAPVMKAAAKARLLDAEAARIAATYPSDGVSWFEYLADLQRHYCGIAAPTMGDMEVTASAIDAIARAMAKPEPAAEPVEPAQRTHSDDFTMVKWDETEYIFSPGLQAGAMKALWRAYETTGLGLHQETIRESIDAERDHFRLSNVFRDHPAYGVIIQSCGEGIYRLGKPDAKAQPPKGKARTAKTVKPAKPAKFNGYNERTLRAKRKIEADFPDEAADD